MVGYRDKISCICSLADAGSALQEVYGWLGDEKMKYAIRLPANRVLQERIGYSLKHSVSSRWLANVLEEKLWDPRQNDWRLTSEGGNTALDKGATVVAAFAEVDPKRSANMARIRQRDTAPEIAVRRTLHRMGYRFRLHRRDLPGKPDVVLPRHRIIFLIHGCFWHRHPGCRFAYSPKTRVDFWQVKFEANVARDEKVERQLLEMGWSVQVIWECETHDPVSLEALLRHELEGRPI